MAYQLPSGQWVPQPGDVWTFDGLIWRPATPLIVPGPRGGGGSMGPRGPAGPAGPPGSNAIAVGEFQRNTDVPTTNSIVPVPFWSISFTTSEVADILFQLVIEVFEVGPPPDPTTFMGFRFSLDLDGNPLPDEAAFELNLDGGSVNTSVETTPLQTYAPALPAGAHTLNVFWQTNDVDNTILSGYASVAIQSI